MLDSPGPPKSSAAFSELPEDLVEFHLQNSLPEYFSVFDEKNIALHLGLMKSCTDEAPVRLQLTIQESSAYLLDICGRDTFGIFTLIAGILAKNNLDINEGFSFSHKSENEHGWAWFAVRFSGTGAESTHSSAVIEKEINSYALPLYRGEMKGSLKKIRVDVVKLLGKKMLNAPAVDQPVQISVSQSESATRLHVTGHTGSGFLYTMCNALALRNILINQVNISTENGQVDDIISITDRFKNPIVNPEKLERLKTAILLIKHFTGLLSVSPDINQALEQFDRFLDRVFSEGMDSEMILGMDDSRVLSKLAAAFGSSEFIWEEFINIQTEALLPIMRKLDSFKHQKSMHIFSSELENLLSGTDNFEEAVNNLNSYKDRELLRIDLLYLIYPNKTFFQFSRELTELADTVLNAAVHLIRQKMQIKNGLPRTGGDPCRFCLLAQGKLGGRELGYASDLELILIYEGGGRTDGEKPVSNADWFNQFMQMLIKSVRAKKQGIFVLDLRLRPHGDDGPLASSFKSWKKYYGPGGSSHDYEKQALIKLRPIYGDPEFRQRVLSARDEIVWGGDNLSLDSLIAQRQKQINQLVKPGTLNAKYSEGGLCDLEYSIQYLQLLHGLLHENIRDPNTLRAMDSLLNRQIISPSEFEMLFRSLAFLRRLINALRVVRGNAKDLLLPEPGSDQYRYLMRRMGYSDSRDHVSEELFSQDLQDVFEDIKSFYQSKFIDSSVTNRAETGLAHLLTQEVPFSRAPEILAADGYRDVKQAVASMNRILSLGGNRQLMLCVLVMSRRYIQKSPSPDQVLINFERYLQNPELTEIILEQMIYNPAYLEIAILIFGHGDFLAGILINFPYLLHYVGAHSSLAEEKSLEDYRKEIKELVDRGDLSRDQYKDLHIYFKREILRTGIRDIFHNITLGSVIREISNLADIIIQSLYTYVFKQAGKQDFLNLQSVIVLGKLGGRELNYSSDIDLVIVTRDIKDDEVLQQLESLNREVFNILSGTSPQGQIFRIDTSLKPYGTQGTFLASENHYRNYFEKTARGWEFQAWIKARSLVGNSELGRRIIDTIHSHGLAEKNHDKIKKNIQEVRLSALKQYKRSELYWEVKQSPGGIRTAEFYTQLLQLQHGRDYPEIISGHTMKSLNKLTEIGVLEHSKAEEITRAYVFFRRIEHALQLEGMQQKHLLPQSDIEVEKLAKRMGFEKKLDASVLKQFFEKYHQYAGLLIKISAEIFPDSLDYLEISDIESFG